MTSLAPSEISPFSPYRADGKLYGFICIVTGALEPLGRAIAHELATHGAACIYLCGPESDLSSPAAEDLVSAIEKSAPKTKCIPYPLPTISSDEQATLALIDEALNAWGRLDVWVCCPPAATQGPAKIADTAPRDLQLCFESHALAPFFALKYAAPAMGKLLEEARNYPNAARKDQAYGSIIVVGSVASFVGGGGWGPCFTLSAHAALGVVRSGVGVLKGTGVRVNSVSVGKVDESGEGPGSGGGEKNDVVERAGTPTEVARVVGFLASGFSAYVNGANLVVDGGATVMAPLAMSS